MLFEGISDEYTFVSLLAYFRFKKTIKIIFNREYSQKKSSLMLV